MENYPIPRIIRLAGKIVAMDAQLAEQLRFLKDVGAGDTGHSHTTLLAHLGAVRALLVEWGARPALVDAGLFHSVYGTEYFSASSVGREERSRVRAQIGADAEGIAYLWCTLRRRSLAQNLNRGGEYTAVDRTTDEEVELTPAQLHDLVNLWCADTCEQVARLGGKTQHQETLFSLRVLALPKAREAVESALEALVSSPTK